MDRGVKLSLFGGKLSHVYLHSVATSVPNSKKIYCKQISSFSFMIGLFCSESKYINFCPMLLFIHLCQYYV